jgi:phosphoglycerol transferase MdoB-like AlkP superfamily enzyme
MHQLKSKLGPLFPIIATCFVMLGIYMISRILLSIWHADRVFQDGQWANFFVSAIRVDFSGFSRFFILPAIVTILASGSRLLEALWMPLLRAWIVFGIMLAVFMEAVTPGFILEYDLRPNRLFIEYLDYPAQVGSMLWGGYKMELFFALMLLFMSFWYGRKFALWATSNLPGYRWYLRPIVGLMVAFVLLLGARSSLGHRPLNPAMVAYSTDPLVNDLVLNSSYSIGFAYLQMKDFNDAYSFYPKQDDQKLREAIALTSMFPLSDSGASDPYFSKPAGQPFKQKNIVILLLESHGARYVSHLGGIDASPNLDRIAENGWVFTNMYATGTRSARGIEAVISGFPPTPARSTVKLPQSQTGFFTIADLLKKIGYETQFIYGGESHFDNMKSFFLGNGVQSIHDREKFSNPEFIGSWGASDEDLFDEAHSQFIKFHENKKPFFSLVFTSSNHTPYEFPDGKIDLFKEPKQSVENAVKYADFAVGEFYDQARKSPYWNDTVFVVIADHDARSHGEIPIPVEHFHIPAIIFGGGIEHKIDDRLISQLDIPQTLLSLIGVDSQNPMLGNDYTREVGLGQRRAVMQRDKNFGFMNAAGDLVVFEPGEKVSSFRYNKKDNSLEEADVSDQVIELANSYALWGSYLLRNGYYRANKDYSLPRE